MVVCFYRKFKGKIAELFLSVKALLQPKTDKNVSAKPEEQCAKRSVLEIQLDLGR